MTAPLRIQPPADYYNRPPKELAGYQNTNVGDGEEVQAPTRPTSGESITLLTCPAGMGCTLTRQPAALTDYIALDKVRYDAGSFNAARIVINVLRAGALGSRARLRYSPSGLIGTYIDAGINLAGVSTPLVCKIDSPGIKFGSLPLALAARTDVYWEVVFENGDGTVSPVIGAVFVQFMERQFRACTWTTIVPTNDFVASGGSMMADSRWAMSGNVGAFQSGCTAPSCLAHLNTFRFGTGASIDAKGTRVFSVGDFPQLTPGRTARILGEMSWTYLFRTCPQFNQFIRLTLSVNGVVYTNVPSGFPPYDTSWLQVTVPVNANGSGEIICEIGIFGDSGICSVSINGMFRNFQLQVLDDGSGGEDCI